MMISNREIKPAADAKYTRCEREWEDTKKKKNQTPHDSVTSMPRTTRGNGASSRSRHSGTADS